MNSTLRKKRAALLAFALILLVSACVTSTADISEDLSPAELIQRGLEASDHNRYQTALLYYQALLERNQNNMELVCTAEYEIAFIHYKQKKYDDARTELNSLLERYNSPDQELLPQQYKRLASIVLDSITEKEKPRFPFNLFKKKET